MKVIEDNFNETIKEATVIVLGSFDGIHKGHRALIKNAKKLTKKLECENEKVNVMVCTFKDHPLSVVHKELCPKLIMSNREKCKLFEKLHIDILNFMEFDESFMKISPEEFISNLINYYNAKGIVVGFNYRFGYKNLGDVSLLKEYSEKLNYELLIVDPVKIKDEVVSSSVIRHYIEEGNIKKANKFLDKPFMLKGEVIKGRQIGRTLGFPTANLSYSKKFIVPQGGVYGTIVEYEKQYYKGITNIGYNPTVQGNRLSVETNILDFCDDIYGKCIKIYFIEKIREEKRFSNIDGLKNQLTKDKNYIKLKDYNSYIKDIIKGK